MFKRQRKSGQQIGCGFLAWTGLGLLTLFIINNSIIKILFSANLQNTDERLFQAAQFILPIGMLFVEYWLIDAIVMMRHSLRSRKSDESD